ncbi:MAG: hypothetical protein ABSD31_06865 [Candidatus Binataceae bacterium]|jgi:hypothetical protein
MGRDLLGTLRFREKARPALWLSALAYARRVLLGDDEIPWSRPAEFLNFFQQAHGLLRPSVAQFEIGAFYDAWLAANPAALRSMAGKRRLGFALKELLAVAEPRALLCELLRAVRSAYGSTPLAITIPSPGSWVASAHALANGVKPVGVSEEDAESASIYVADFLRALAESSLDGLLLEEDYPCGAASAESLSTYQPVINVAQHYNWGIGLLSLGGACAPAALAGLDFYITDTDCEGDAVGRAIPDSFWAGEDPPAVQRGFYYLKIPEDALPETVLERLAQLH